MKSNFVTASDVRAFADVATSFRENILQDGSQLFSLVIDAKPISLTVGVDGRCEVEYSGDKHTFKGFESFLASEWCADLKKWAANQKNILAPQFMQDNDGMLRVSGMLETQSGSHNNFSAESLDGYLSSQRDVKLYLLVLDGPAGIGKSSLLRRLAYNRATNFQAEQSRLILHVESRGRNLQVLDDLIAGSLQRLRAKPTFDQLRVLVKYGLVLLALDGFDELADPNGFQLAWAQLADIIDSVSGNAHIILSGRETLVSKKRIISEITLLSRPDHLVEEFRLSEVSTETAHQWLLAAGIPQNFLDNPRLSEALRPNSYALRPFFLSKLREKDVYRQLNANSKRDLVSILITALIDRETSLKISPGIVEKIGQSAISQFLRDVCQEISRDMADNQSEAIPGSNVEWIAEMCAPKNLPSGILRQLIHHTTRLPFLTVDEQSSAVRFSHRQFFVFFLGESAISALCSGEIPKFIRRNSFGTEFLEAFPKVISDVSKATGESFRDTCIELLPELSAFDRSRGNVVTLLLSCIADYPPPNTLKISGVSVDEAFLRGTMPILELEGVLFSRLDITSCDMSGVTFDKGCQVFTLISDSRTILPESLPMPSWLEMGSFSSGKYDEIAEKLGASDRPTDQVGREHQLKPQGAFDRELLDRVIRYRPFWLRDDRDNLEPAGLKILDSTEWSELLDYLIQHDLVRVDQSVPAAGPSSRFIHFRTDEIRAHFGI